MGWYTALLFRARIMVRDPDNTEASLPGERRKWFGCLVTFWLVIFAMLFHTGRSLKSYWSWKHSRWMIRCTTSERFFFCIVIYCSAITAYRVYLLYHCGLMISIAHLWFPPGRPVPTYCSWLDIIAATFNTSKSVDTNMILCKLAGPSLFGELELGLDCRTQLRKSGTHHLEAPHILLLIGAGDHDSI